MSDKSVKPHLIDLYNVETTNKLIPQSFQYVLKTLLTKYYSNKYLMNIYNNFDDYSFILNFIINYICLLKTDSTFIENNFNLSYEFNDKYINRKDLILVTLFDNFGIDYITTKLERHRDNLLQKFKLIKKNYKKNLIEEQGKFWEDNIDDFKDHIKKKINLNHYIFMFKYYPKIKRTLKIISMCLKLIYHKGYSDHYSFIQYIFGIKQKKMSLFNSMTSKIFLYLVSIVKIVEYYNRENFLATILSSDDILMDELPLPEPVYNEKELVNVVKKGVCPICNLTAVNPTCCKDTGLVFCYNCIYNHLDNQRNNNMQLRCPLTNTELLHGFDGLIKIKA